MLSDRCSQECGWFERVLKNVGLTVAELVPVVEYGNPSRNPCQKHSSNANFTIQHLVGIEVFATYKYEIHIAV